MSDKVLDFFNGDIMDSNPLNIIDDTIVNNTTMFIDRIYDIIGKKFGRLTVLSFEGRVITGKKKPSAKKLYKVKCDCGKELLVIRGNLVGGEKRSCGCRRTELVIAINASKRQIDVVANWNFLYNFHLKDAKERNHITELSLEQFKELSIQNCYYCGQEPVDRKIMRFHRGILANGIDRVDNKLGYIFSNCKPCCTLCNRMKLNNTQEQFFEKVKAIYNKHFNNNI